MADSERRKQLMETIKQFNKDHKSEVFSMGNEIEELKVIPSGVKKIDDFLGGGFRCGGHTIIWSPSYSVGKTALALTTIANAQKLGKLVCYVNTEKPIEPQRFEFFGVKLDDMLYIEAPENAEKALEAMRTLCRDKVIDLFIIDSTNGLCPKSVQEEKGGKERSLEKKNVASLPLVLSSFYNIVSAHIFRSKAAIIWVGQGRTKNIGSFFTHCGLSGGKAQEFYASSIISMRKGQNENAPMQSVKRFLLDKDQKLRYKTENVPVGFDVVLKLQKTNSCKSAKENAELHVPFIAKKGFVDIVEEKEQEIEITGTKEQKEIIEKMLIEKGIIKTPPRHDIKKMVDDSIDDLSEVVDVTDAKEELKKLSDKEKTKKFQDDVKIGDDQIKKGETTPYSEELVDKITERAKNRSGKEKKPTVAKDPDFIADETKPKKRGRGRPKKQK